MSVLGLTAREVRRFVEEETKLMKAQLEALAAQQSTLQDAFNKFFDAVAEDLGYEAVQCFASGLFTWVDPDGAVHCSINSSNPKGPRQLAETVTPERREVKRRKTARCRKRRGP